MHLAHDPDRIQKSDTGGFEFAGAPLPHTFSLYATEHDILDMRLGLSTAREKQQNEKTGGLGQDEVMLLAG
jgi:hypothetical protein